MSVLQVVLICLIQSAQLNDAGIYTCVAINRFNEDNPLTHTGQLIVRSKSSAKICVKHCEIFYCLSAARTQIVNAPVSTRLVAGNDLTLRCGATTDPEEMHNLRVVWMLDGNVISSDRSQGIVVTRDREEHTLTILSWFQNNKQH